MKRTRISKVLLFLLLVMIVACQPAKSLSPPSTLAITSTAAFLTASPTETPTSTVTIIPSPTLAPETDLIKGAWFTDWGLGPGVDTLDGREAITKNIVPLGANWIALQVPCQMNVDEPSEIICNYNNSLSLSGIKNVTKFAHSIGVRVALFSFPLDVVGAIGNWSANLNYGSDQEKWSVYFDTYTRNLLTYANVAEDANIDLLIIGGEQTGAQPQEAHWRTLIGEVRSIYHGKITYEAWCDTFDNVKWWDAVDYIGINFYCFPLANSSKPSDEEVKANYLKFLKMVRNGTSNWNKQIIFTEIGYESIGGVSQIVPFGLTPVKLNVEEQGTLVRNFFEALKEFGNDDKWLKGLFWYNFTSSPLLGGMGDLNFNPHNKPAEIYIRAFYKGQEPDPLPALPTQVDENLLKISYWIFNDKLENGTVFGPWAGNGLEEIVDDPINERGKVIRVKILNQWDGIDLQMLNVINLREYDFLEMYLYAPQYEPNLDMTFSGKFEEIVPFVYLRNFIDHEPLVDGKWHRISVPLKLLYPEGRPDKISEITSMVFLHMWPGEAKPLSFYLDDIRLVKTSK